MITRKITLILRGETDADLEDAFEDAVELIANGVGEHKTSRIEYGFHFVNRDQVPAEEVP